VDADRKELNMGYHFDGVSLRSWAFQKNESKWSLVEFKESILTGMRYMTKGWGTIYLGNHDQPRMVSRWGNDSAEFREYSSKC
jgi:oligo-1,6-glucosidase